MRNKSDDTGSGTYGQNRGRSGDRFSRRTQGERVERERIVKKYFPIFENLILFILDTRRYWRTFQAYIKKEFGRRSRLLILAVIFLVIALVFLVSAILMLILGLFLVLEKLTGSMAISAFIFTGAGLLVTMSFMGLMALMVKKLFTFESESESRYRDDDDY